MSRLLGVVFIYAAMILAWIGVGLFMIAAPVRFGNLLHDSLQVFPEVRRGDWGKKLFLRLLGVCLLSFAIRTVFLIAREAP